MAILLTCDFFIQWRKPKRNIAETRLGTLFAKNQSCVCIHDLYINEHWTGGHIMLHGTGAPVELHIQCMNSEGKKNEEK